jgi:hypothetical protein
MSILFYSNDGIQNRLEADMFLDITLLLAGTPRIYVMAGKAAARRNVGRNQDDNQV